MDELTGIEFRHLRYFAEVAESGTVTEAARRLHIAQPSLSQQIRSLERRLGTPLFHRGQTGMALTDAGRIMLEGVNRAMGELRASVAAVHGVALPARIGVCRGVPQDVLVAAEQVINRQRPLRLVYDATDSHQQGGLLLSGKLTFGILRPPIAEQGLVTRTLSDQPLGIVVSRTNPLAERAELTWSDLADHRLLWFPESRAPGYAAEVVAVLAANGWKPHVVPADHDQASHTLFRHALLSDGRLVALRPRHAVADDSALAWIPIGPNPPRERLVLAAMAGTPWGRLLS
ncbi:MAG: LysR family transcriptional regulator [Kutzneria sp.]|nr:LysR family transcriptional regulator [Kutzneria sp.]